MSVANKNPFALLSDDGEPAPVAAAPAKAAQAPAAQAARSIPGAANSRRGGARNGAPRAEQGADAPADGEKRDNRRRGGEGRGRGAPRGRGRGGRGRPFDRHSQTDRVDSQKQVAQGWGGEDGKKELESEEKAEADAKAEGAENGTAAAAAAATDRAAEVEKVPEEEEDKTMTLDQYLAAKAGKKLNIESKAPRAVASDDSAYSKLTKLESKEEEYFAATKTQKLRSRPQKEGKQILEIEQTFNQPAVQQRGGRGGRGGSRGAPRGERGASRGRGGRGGRGSGAQVNLADNAAFPKLA
ncbi:hypothetical protein BCV70DRAFT_217760 [Testicularia cyperi]|uniref:Hyaluronan/mRNA-binding protein domain-containing protein n=1 Tax=Testicularia cyperi TaxID=1882483 RepID=A0A317XM55_9BASI|nr:hypothetical protein BCV70DRAFT_217760 [Testicularia cyperi]